MSLSLLGIVVIAYIITTILTNISEGMEEVRIGAIMRKKFANLKESITFYVDMEESEA